MSLEELRVEEREIRQRVAAAQAILHERWAELREVKAKIRAIEHPPRPRNERGLKLDDDLSFIFHEGRTSWPKSKEARHAEKWRRERIKTALWYAFCAARDEGIVLRWTHPELYEDFEAREKEFYRTTPIAELMRLERKERGL